MYKLRCNSNLPKTKFLKQSFNLPKMEINYNSFCLSLETAFRSALRGSVWFYGDKLLAKYTRQNEIDLTISETREVVGRINGFLVNCSALGLNAYHWSGSREDARRVACWKWFRKLFRKSGASEELYWRCVKKYAKEVIEIGDQCILCNEYIKLERLWEHVRLCSLKEPVLCAFCNGYFPLEDYPDHLDRCKKMNCTLCGLSILKIDEAKHKAVCQKDVIELESCPFCDQLVECAPTIYTAHVRECKRANGDRVEPKNIENKCKICGDQDDERHQCTRCPICLDNKPVANWIILDCNHYICDECSPNYFANEYEVSNAPKCPVCRRIVTSNEVNKVFL